MRQTMSICENTQLQPFDYMVYIGRFQPFHLAHYQVLSRALQQAKSVILVLGSAQDERTIKNPFTVQERQQMILHSFTTEQQRRLIFAPIIDVYHDKKWVKLVKQAVHTCILNQQLAEEKHADVDALLQVTQQKIGLIGHFKDDSSYYLALFPAWTLIDVENLYQQLSATPIRQKFYRGEVDDEHLPHYVQHFLRQFQHTDVYEKLKDFAQRQDERVIDSVSE